MKRIRYVILLFLFLSAVYYFYPEKPLPLNKKITLLVVIKSERVLHVYSSKELLKTYSIALGKSPQGNKEKEGDKRTPEGSYFINDKNPNSSFYKNLGISYPNVNEQNRAKAKGLNPGGDIKIHGIKKEYGFIRKFHRISDWTNGCIAVTNEEMDELYVHVPIGTPIVIKP